MLPPVEGPCHGRSSQTGHLWDGLVLPCPQDSDLCFSELSKVRMSQGLLGCEPKENTQHEFRVQSAEFRRVQYSYIKTMNFYSIVKNLLTHTWLNILHTHIHTSHRGHRHRVSVLCLHSLWWSASNRKIFQYQSWGKSWMSCSEIDCRRIEQ